MKERQPNSRHCFVCGLRNPFGLKITFYQTGPEEVSAEYIVDENYQGYPGVVHGGIVACMLDEAAGRVYMDIDPPRFMYTARLDIRYRKNAPTNIPLRLVGQGIRDRGRVAEARSFLYDPQGELLAEAQALLVNLPDDTLASADKDSLGWRVYSDEEITEIHKSTLNEKESS